MTVLWPYSDRIVAVSFTSTNFLTGEMLIKVMLVLDGRSKDGLPTFKIL